MQQDLLGYLGVNFGARHRRTKRCNLAVGDPCRAYAEEDDRSFDVLGIEVFLDDAPGRDGPLRHRSRVMKPKPPGRVGRRYQGADLDMRYPGLLAERAHAAGP